MLPRLLLTLGVVLYGLAVPVLEINDTHVFNPGWPPHARLHEVWQLATNSAIGLFSLWLVWARRQVVVPALLALLVTGGFLFAYATRSMYGGSMVLSDGTEKTALGINLGVLGFGIVILAAVVAIMLDHRAAPR
jgi:hypothetical protein